MALYVGRLAPEKNLNLAIESYRAMQRVNAAVKFVLVGDGPLRAALQKTSRSHFLRHAHGRAIGRACMLPRMSFFFRARPKPSAT